MREVWVLMPEDEYQYKDKILVYRWLFAKDYTLGRDPLWFSSAEEAELKATAAGILFKKFTKDTRYDADFFGLN